MQHIEDDVRVTFEKKEKVPQIEMEENVQKIIRGMHRIYQTGADKIKLEKNGLSEVSPRKSRESHIETKEIIREVLDEGRLEFLKSKKPYRSKVISMASPMISHKKASSAPRTRAINRSSTQGTFPIVRPKDLSCDITSQSVSYKLARNKLFFPGSNGVIHTRGQKHYELNKLNQGWANIHNSV